MADFVITGLDPLLRDLRASGNKAATRDVYRGLRAAGNVIRDEIRSQAEGQGLVASGGLVKSVKVTRASARGVTIAATATRRGYPYPSVYEYGRVDHRPFAEPGLQAALPEAVLTLETRIDATLKEHNL